MNKTVAFFKCFRCLVVVVAITAALSACSNNSDSLSTNGVTNTSLKGSSNSLLSTEAGSTTIEINAGEFEITKDHQGLDFIEMKAPGYGRIESPGDPLLPQKILEIPVPQDTDPRSIKISVDTQTSRVLSDYTIGPTPPLGPVIDDDPNFTFEYDPNEEIWGTGKSIVDGKNVLVYSSDANYPPQTVAALALTQRKIPNEPIVINPLPIDKGATIPSSDKFVHAAYVRIAFRPFLYNPVSQQLLFTEKATVSITYGPSPPTPARVIQPQVNGAYDYVIITTNAIVTNSEKLDNFIHLKQLAGHSVLVVTEADYGTLTGQAPNGTAEKIRQWLINNYSSLGIDYVLLVGNPNPDDPTDPGDTVGDVPMKMCWPNYHGWTYRESPTDYFYADLTGNWNLDNDDYFCEALAATRDTSPDPLIHEDTFSARWTGKVLFDFTENYRFHTFSDDGVRVYLDGTLIIDEWTEHAPTNHYATQAVTAGKHDITVEFRETTGDGMIQLFWNTTVPEGHANFVAHQIIPQDHLYDAADVVGGLSATYYDNSDFTGTSISRKDNTINFIWATGDRGTGGPDSGAEVFVGRIPVYNDDYTQLDAILDKIIHYQSDTGDISWRRSILLPMKPLWDDTPSYHLGEGIRNDYALTDGFAAFRIYDEDYNPPTPELWPTSVANVSSEWANGYGVVTWATHGSQSGASHIFSSNDASALDDAKPAFTFQASCLNGYPENANNLGFALLKHGAIATVSASRVSFESHGAWTFDPNSGLNHNLAYFYDKKLMNAVTPRPAGVALYLTKGNVPNIGMNEADYNLYGDPATGLFNTVSNSPPIADANGPYQADEGTIMSFDASASADPEGEALEYRWDFEDDGIWDTDWSSTPTADHTWSDNFIGTAKVQVRDLLGFTAESTAAVTVNNVAPSAQIDDFNQPNPQFILPVIHTVTFNGSFSDPGWLDSHNASWDFGDGTVVTGIVSEENSPPEATGTTHASHAFASPGVYTITLTVTDDDGGIDTDTVSVTVVDAEQAKHDINDFIQALPDSAFKNNPAQRKNALNNMFRAIDEMLQNGAYQGAISDLKNNVRGKADGHVDGNPNNDWIIDPIAQQEIAAKIDDLIAYLEYLKNL